MELLTLDEQLELAGKEHLELESTKELLKAAEALLKECQTQLAIEKLNLKHLNTEMTEMAEQLQILARIAVLANGLVIAAKPFAVKAIDLKPGEEMKWVIVYTFSHDPPLKK